MCFHTRLSPTHESFLTRACVCVYYIIIVCITLRPVVFVPEMNFPRVNDTVIGGLSACGWVFIIVPVRVHGETERFPGRSRWEAEAVGGETGRSLMGGRGRRS